MRILKPEVAEERKRRLLQWVVHRFMKTASPVSSQTIAQEAGFKLSSATIRNALKELEDEGYLFQEHASSGRVPTDKGYRLYIDYLVEMQKLAAKERERIESEYGRRVSELDQLLAQTSRMLSHLSRSAGFALSPKLGSHPVRRIELVPLSGRHAIVVVMTQTGLIRHWPIQLNEALPPDRLRLLGEFLRENVEGLTVEELREELGARIDRAERELSGLVDAARLVLGQVARAAGPEELFIDGAASLAELPMVEPSQLRSVLRVVEDRERLARILQEEFEEQLRKHRVSTGPDAGTREVQVRIGRENLPELRDLSLVASTYEAGERLVGLLGILGPRHMQYPKMMALVRFVGAVVSETMSRWEDLYLDDDGKAPAPESRRRKRSDEQA